MDPMTAARTAREGLARSLGLLQSPALPPQLSRVVEQVAQAMGLLHRIEATRGGAFAETAPQALAITRQALGELQSFNLPHPEVEGALEAIAGALGTIHQLAQAAAQQAPAEAAPVSPYAGTMLDAPRMPPLPPQPAHYPSAAQPPQSHHAPPPYAPPPAYHAQPPQSHHAPPQSQHAQPPYPPQPHYAQPPAQYPAPPPSQVPAHPQQHPYGAPPASSQWQPPPGWQQPSAPQAPHPPAPDWEQKAPPPSRVPAPVGPGAPVRIEAALGAHSPTNFYKGLSGNDVIDSGGLFVATYQLPPIGAQVHLKVALPGGYEFEAIGVVRWARETRDTSSDAPPGFGAQIVQITPEARQLVYRYVRNREPLFHDDI